MSESVANKNIVVKLNDRRLSSIRNIKFTYGKHEYRVNYMGGFAEIERREIGKRNFEYFGAVDDYKYYTAQDIMNAAIEMIVANG